MSGVPVRALTGEELRRSPTAGGPTQGAALPPPVPRAPTQAATRTAARRGRSASPRGGPGRRREHAGRDRDDRERDQRSRSAARSGRRTSRAPAIASAPRPIPSGRPSAAPISAVITLSWRIIRRVCRRVMPTARSIPSSRVRSKTASTSVFTIPNSDTITRQREQDVEAGSSRRRATASCSSTNALFVCAFASGKAASARSSPCGESGVDERERVARAAGSRGRTSPARATIPPSSESRSAACRCRARRVDRSPFGVWNASVSPTRDRRVVLREVLRARSRSPRAERGDGRVDARAPTSKRYARAIVAGSTPLTSTSLSLVTSGRGRSGRSRRGTTPGASPRARARRPSGKVVPAVLRGDDVARSPIWLGERVLVEREQRPCRTRRRR